MDACSACVEQHTVFTQVLAKALNQLVDKTPLPLLFMRTLIQVDVISVTFTFVSLVKVTRWVGTEYGGNGDGSKEVWVETGHFTMCPGRIDLQMANASVFVHFQLRSILV